MALEKTWLVGNFGFRQSVGVGPAFRIHFEPNSQKQMEEKDIGTGYCVMTCRQLRGLFFLRT